MKLSELGDKILCAPENHKWFRWGIFWLLAIALIALVIATIVIGLNEPIKFIALGPIAIAAYFLGEMYSINKEIDRGQKYKNK